MGNAAFAKVPNATLTALLADKANLTEVLKYHVVSGKVPAADLTNGEKVPTLEGNNLTITIQGTGANATVMVNNATVTTADVEASNGVVHIIDAVLIPPDVVLPPADKAE